jgi:hypothetical protein
VNVRLEADGRVLVAELDGEEVGRAELRVGEQYVWVETLRAERPGVDEELFRHAREQALALERELERRQGLSSAGRVYVQSDDESAIGRAVRQFIPRLGRSERTEISQPRSGWITVEDELCSREPKLLRRLAKEISDRTGAVVLLLGLEDGAVVRYILFERGSIADEYASVPEFHGPLPPGDVIALGANPTVVARLTGADPERVRAVARTAKSVEELPPAQELYEQLADLLGVGSEAE